MSQTKTNPPPRPFQTKQVWTVSKVTGLVPQLREVNALVTAPRSPLFPSLTHDMSMSHTTTTAAAPVRAAPPPSSSSSPSIAAAADAAARRWLKDGVLTTLYSALESKLDQSQLAAAGHVVAASSRGSGLGLGSGEAVGPPAISLVQGPPGTGKSTTLLAMVGLLLHVGGAFWRTLHRKPVHPAPQFLMPLGGEGTRWHCTPKHASSQAHH